MDCEDAVQIGRIRLLDEIVSESPRSSVSDYEIQPKRQRRSGGWTGLRKRVRDALQQVRVLIFVHVEELKKCLETRLSAVFRWKTLAWKALLQLHKTSRSDLPDRLLEMNTCKEEDIIHSTVVYTGSCVTRARQRVQTTPGEAICTTSAVSGPSLQRELS
ncbi:hypothetical protein V7S43_015033 [Phytophthora oleae]|uniref:Uncharacterized protein n=1 Tax=Phytophthora oleae TaxID=2107226 RepID=A0ABD3EZW3_9STRA